MTPCIPHFDLVFLHFQSVKPWRSLIMKGFSLFQRTASQLIWLRYVCQNGGTVSEAYIFYERSLIWLNNLTISPLKVSSSSQLMWLSLCLNKITQMHYAIFVMLWFFFSFHQGLFVLFSSLFFIRCLKRKVNFLHFLESQINVWTEHTVHFAMCEIKSHTAPSSSAEDDLGNPFHKIRDKHFGRKAADSQPPFPFWSNLKWRAASFPLWRADELPRFSQSLEQHKTSSLAQLWLIWGWESDSS